MIKNVPTTHVRSDCNKGFTLIELMVSMAIFAVITALVIGKFKSFDGSVLLTNLSYDVALTIRTAQSYGMNVHELSPGSGQFSYAYGVHLDMSTPTTYVLFVDANNNGKYDGGGELVNTYSIKRGSKLSSLCGGTSFADCTGITYLDVTFKRPNPDAILRSNIFGSTPSYAQIWLTDPSASLYREIIVQSNGLISIP